MEIFLVESNPNRLFSCEIAVQDLNSDEECTVCGPIQESKDLNHPVYHLSAVPRLQVVSTEAVYIVGLVSR